MSAELSPSARQGQDRREEILRAAVEVFGEFGFAGARVDEVATRVGIRRPSLLYHFPDKQVLHSAALENVVGDVAGRILATEHVDSERLVAITNVWIDFVLDRPNAARMLLRELLDGSPSGAPAAFSRALGSVRTLLSSIQSALDARLAVDAHVLSGRAKQLDAGEFSLILSSTSLVWVAGQTAVKGALGLDTLAPEAVARHRRTLHSLVRQLVAASVEADEADELDNAPRNQSAGKP